MTISSMTGFARASGSTPSHSWLWEAKSVNGRGLEIRCRMPPGFDQLEHKLRKVVKAHFVRGSINIHLQLDSLSLETAFRVNVDFLEELLKTSESYVDAGRAHPPRMDGMLGLKGVIEQKDKNSGSENMEALEAALLVSAEELIASLMAARQEEGGQLLPILNDQLAEIEQLVSQAVDLASRQPEASRLKLKAQMERILAEQAGLDEARLEQELALVATKLDVSEELDRLTSHVTSTRDMLNGAAEKGIGRRLDFICQEFNREANTLCSKANDKDLTQIGLDLKVLIDRMREQVQNIE